MTSMSDGPLLRSSPLCSAQGTNLKRADAASGPGCGLPRLASQRQHAARPECCGRVICGMSIAGCTVHVNHHCSATISGQQATGAVPYRLPGGSPRLAASLDSRRSFIIFCQCARIEDDGSQVPDQRLAGNMVNIAARIHHERIRKP